LSRTTTNDVGGCFFVNVCYVLRLLSFRLTDEEYKLLEERIADSGKTNREDFLRHIALNGLIFHVDLEPIRKLLYLQGNISNNINQIAKRANTVGRAYETDVLYVQTQARELQQSIDMLILDLLGKNSGDNKNQIT